MHRVDRVVVVSGLLAATFTLATPAAAQQLGFKGGLTLAEPDAQVDTIFGPVPFILDSRAGFAAGGFVLVPLGAHLGVQPEVLFIRRQFHLGGNPNVPTLQERAGDALEIFAPIDTEFRADYLQIPVLLRVSLGGPLAAHGLVGPAIGFNLDAKLRNNVFQPRNDQDVADGITDVDVSLIVGGGIELGSRIAIDGRYDIGMVDVLDDSFEGPVGIPPVRWRSFSVMLGLLF